MTSTTTTTAPTKESVKKLIQEKDDMEREIAQLIRDLDNCPVGRTGSLVDEEGFPRSDLDLNLIRTQRHRLACLQNDHIALMKRIEDEMAQFYQSVKDQSESHGISDKDTTGATSASAASDSVTEQQQQQQEPFAIVNSVAPDSPASECGLQRGDKIVLFGSVTKRQVDQNGGLGILASAVDANLNRKMPIKVQRDDTMNVSLVNLTLVPKAWSGKGYLGCHLLPITHH